MFEALPVGGPEVLAGGARRQPREQQEIEHELLVADRLLAIAAVGRVLCEALPLENAACARSPFVHSWPVGPRHRSDPHTGGLTDEMVVRRREPRQVVDDGLDVQVNAAQPALAKLPPVRSGEQPRPLAAQQLPRDAPVDQPDRDFQRARPVRAAPDRTLLDPRFDVLSHSVRVAQVAAQRVRLRERHQVQVPVGLPQVLDVADAPLVAVVDGACRAQRRQASGERVAVPFRRIAEVAARRDGIPQWRPARRRSACCT